MSNHPKCINCGKKLRGTDNRCRTCGNGRGKGAYSSASDFLMQCVYGPPPVATIFTCRECEHRWSSRFSDEKICPKCGSTDVKEQ